MRSATSACGSRAIRRASACLDLRGSHSRIHSRTNPGCNGQDTKAGLAAPLLMAEFSQCQRALQTLWTSLLSLESWVLSPVSRLGTFSVLFWRPESCVGSLSRGSNSGLAASPPSSRSDGISLAGTLVPGTPCTLQPLIHHRDAGSVHAERIQYCVSGRLESAIWNDDHVVGKN